MKGDYERCTTVNSGANAEQMLSPKELAAELSKCQRTLATWRRDKAGPPYIRVVGRIYYRRADIEDWKRRNLWA